MIRPSRTGKGRGCTTTIRLDGTDAVVQDVPRRQRIGIGLYDLNGDGLGTLSGLADRIWRDEQRRLMFRAGAISVITWVAGMGFRFLVRLLRLSLRRSCCCPFLGPHGITGADTWDHRAGLDGLRSGAGPPGRQQVRRVRAVSQPAAPRQVPAAGSHSAADAPLSVGPFDDDVPRVLRALAKASAAT